MFLSRQRKLQPYTTMTLPKILIGTPAHDRRVHVKYCYSLLQLCASGIAEFRLETIGGGGISMARNEIAADLLRTPDYSGILWIDSDIEFKPWMVHRLLSYGFPIVGATYALKSKELKWSAHNLRGYTPDPGSHIFKASAVGTGFLWTAREVFEKIRGRNPEIAYKDSHGDVMWDFFGTGVIQDPKYYPEPTYLTEDFYFCYRALKAGYDINIDASFYPNHIGEISYPLNGPKIEEPELITEGTP